MIVASCHCGAVRLEIAERPTQITSCNCSLCRRIGSQMAYYRRDQLKIICAPGATTGYVQGDRTLALHHCNVCGCTTHWENIDPTLPDKIGVNTRMIDPAELAGVPVRKFDGADTWKFLDE